jgi:uncharacterized membrane protein YoaK (UPF0700 family)
MDILSLFAQSTYEFSEYQQQAGPALDNGAVAAVLALMLITFVIGLFIGVIFYVYFSICLMKIFKKAGVKPGIAWVPFYNTWKFLEIGGQKGYWSVLMLVPIVSFVAIVYFFIASYHIGKKLGKSGEFVLWAIFLAPVWYPWLAFDKSVWNDAASPAPSLHNQPQTT